jgi:hypothetical protein
MFTTAGCAPAGQFIHETGKTAKRKKAPPGTGFTNTRNLAILIVKQ